MTQNDYHSHYTEKIGKTTFLPYSEIIKVSIRGWICYFHPFMKLKVNKTLYRLALCTSSMYEALPTLTDRQSERAITQHSNDRTNATILYENKYSLFEPPHDKPTKWHVRPAKTQISLGSHPVWSEFLLSAWRKLGSLASHWAHSEDSDQTGRMPGWSESLLGAHVILSVL